MKLKYVFITLALIASVLLMPAQKASAQDTLLVEWADANGDVVVNALRDAILNDTNRPDGRVYKLQRGGFYWNTDRITNDDFHLRIVGEPGDPNDAFSNPPFVQMVLRTDQSTDGKLIVGTNNVTLKNLYFTGNDDIGTQTYYQPLEFNGNGFTYEFDNCIFEQSNFAMGAYNGAGNVIKYTNCNFRNLVGEPSTQVWEGRGISIWTDQDSVIVENCTFFNLGMTALQIEGGAADYVLFNHNTVVSMGKHLNTGAWWREAYFANNLIINGFWHGEGLQRYGDANREPDEYTTGLFSISALPSQYGPEAGRRVLFTHSAAFLDDAFVNHHADTIRTQPFLSGNTINDFINEYPNMVVGDTTWLSNEPGLPTYSSISALFPNMIQNIEDLTRGITPAAPYFFSRPDDLQGGICYVCPSWPLPENFTYTESSLMTAGTDGLPLGDLNWFPTQKADYVANRDAYVAAIQEMAGPVISLTVESSTEAEALTVGGDAAVNVLAGFTYFTMDQGSIQWDFELASGGQYDLNVWTHMRGNDIRGQRILINGANQDGGGIHDCFGYGEYIWDAVYAGDEPCENPHVGMPINDWAWTKIIQDEIAEAGALTFLEGANVLRIESSWGFQNFAGFDLLEPGTENVVASLRAPDATETNLVTATSGAVYTPSGFKSVDLGTNGSVTWTVNPADDGEYAVQVFYQAPNGDQSLEVSVDGSVATTMMLTGAADSSGASVLSDVFDLTAGSHDIVLTGGQVLLDEIQLIKRTVVSSVASEEVYPEGYNLSQNYPNPFNPSTNISFTIAKSAPVKLSVYNVLGQKVATLVDSPMSAGSHIVNFDASSLSSGVYFYRIEAGDFKANKRMLLIK